jgi:cyclophilin family peptidyl-prolyl cis-trans isomerase
MRKIFLTAMMALLFASVAQAQDTPVPATVSGPVATIETSLGTITIALDAVRAPVTVANFVRYAREKHFDGTVFYRVLPGALIQAGSYDAAGKPRPTHKGIVFEGNNGLANVRGAVAMARGDDPNSATAEFFIDTSDLPSLDHDPKDTGNTTGYAVFGHVTEGMDVVDKIAASPLGGIGPFAGAAPLTPVIIESVTVTP